jgi:hypothetical protein
MLYVAKEKKSDSEQSARIRTGTAVIACPTSLFWPVGFLSSNTVRPPYVRELARLSAVTASTFACGSSLCSTIRVNASSRRMPCSFSVRPIDFGTAPLAGSGKARPHAAGGRRRQLDAYSIVLTACHSLRRAASPGSSLSPHPLAARSNRRRAATAPCAS